MRAVTQHDGKQIAGEAGRVDFPVETILRHQRQAAAVVDVGVRADHEIHRGGLKGQDTVILIAPALQKPAVDQKSLSVHVDAVAASRHFLVGAEKIQMQENSPFLIQFQAAEKAAPEF